MNCYTILNTVSFAIRSSSYSSKVEILLLVRSFFFLLLDSLALWRCTSQISTIVAVMKMAVVVLTEVFVVMETVVMDVVVPGLGDGH